MWLPLSISSFLVRWSVLSWSLLWEGQLLFSAGNWQHHQRIRLSATVSLQWFMCGLSAGSAVGNMGRDCFYFSPLLSQGAFRHLTFWHLVKVLSCVDAGCSKSQKDSVVDVITSILDISIYWWPEFNSRDPHGRRRKLLQTVIWFPHCHMHAPCPTYKVNK